MSKIKPNQLRREIEYNLSIMEKSLKQGIKVDSGFLAIFQNDIEAIGNHAFAATLNERLQKDAEKLYKVASNTLNIPYTPRQLVSSAPISADKIAVHADSAEDKGLKLLFDNGIGVRKIAGDGHCLFRAIATQSLLTAEKTKSPSTLLRLAEKVISSPEYAPVIQATAKEVAALLKHAHFDILNDAHSSDLLVQFLRMITTHGLQKNNTPTIEAMIQAGGDTTESYLAKMADMSERSMGGQAEIIELEKELETPLRILSLDLLGQGSEKLPPKEEHILGNTFLLFTAGPPGHYDLAEVILQPE